MVVVAAVVVEASVASACVIDSDAKAEGVGGGGGGARRLGWVRRMSDIISRAMTCSVSWPLLKQWRKRLRFSFARVCYGHKISASMLNSLLLVQDMSRTLLSKQHNPRQTSPRSLIGASWLRTAGMTRLSTMMAKWLFCSNTHCTF